MAGNENKTDVENPLLESNSESPFAERSVRHEFIRKVFTILACQLLFTLLFVLSALFHQPFQLYVQNNSWMFWVAAGIMLFTMIIMAFCTEARRKSPLNYIFLTLFTIAQGFMLSVVASLYDPRVVLVSIGMCGVVAVSLIVFALQTKWDFTILHGTLFVAVIILVVVGLIVIITQSNILTTIYAGIGALLFSFYLIVDIQLMMGTKYKYEIATDEYIFAALNLYLDIVNIFMFCTTFIGGAST